MQNFLQGHGAPKKHCLSKNCDLCKKHGGGTHILVLLFRHFFFRKFSSRRTFKNSGGVMVRLHFPRSHLAVFWFCLCEIEETMGWFPTPPTMELLDLATLKQKNYPLLCFYRAKSFVSACPPLISHAWGKKNSFSLVPPLVDRLSIHIEHMPLHDVKRVCVQSRAPHPQSSD